MEAGCTRWETNTTTVRVMDTHKQTQRCQRVGVLPLACALLLLAALWSWSLPGVHSWIGVQQRYVHHRTPLAPPSLPPPSSHDPTPTAGRRIRIPVRRVRVDPLAPHPLARRHFTSHAFFGDNGPPARPEFDTPTVQVQTHRRRLMDAHVQTIGGNGTDSGSSTGGIAPLPPAAPPAGPPGKVHLRDYSDYMYIGVLGVGTPAQHFGCVFDTGSADTWVFSTAVPSHRRFSWLNYFDSAASSTFESLRRPWSIRYGKGLARGLVSRDTLAVGQLSIPGQDLAFTSDAGDDETFSHENEPIDGLFGLGFQALATPSYGRTVIEHAREKNVISRRAFSFHMISTAGTGEGDPVPVRSDPSDPESPLDEVASSAADEARHPDSFFVLGEADLALAPHGLHAVPIVPPETVEGRWVVAMDGMGVSGQDVSDFCSADSGATRPCFAWVDTGSSFVLLPTHAFERIMRAIISSRPDCSLGPSPGFRATCTIRETYLLPHVSFVLGGRSFLLAPSEYLLDGADDDGSPVFVLGFSPRASSRAEYDEIILGDTFLKNYYTVFDMDSGHISFANRSPPLEITWPIAVGILGATAALLGATLACVHWKNGRASTAVAASGVDGQGTVAGAEMVQLQLQRSQASRMAAGNGAVDDAGEGEARPRGYAQIAPLSDAGTLDSLSGPTNGTNGNNSNGKGKAKGPAAISRSSPSSSSSSSSGPSLPAVASLRSSPRAYLDDVELTALEAGQRDRARPPSPSGHASSHSLQGHDPDDDNDAAQEL